MAAADQKSHPVLHHLLLSTLFFLLCVCVHVCMCACTCMCVRSHLSATDKSRFGLRTDWLGGVSLGHVGCQGARRCPPCTPNPPQSLPPPPPPPLQLPISPFSPKELSVKTLPPNQSLMGHTRHEFRAGRDRHHRRRARQRLRSRLGE